jgi:DNA repair protein RadC
VQLSDDAPAAVRAACSKPGGRSIQVCAKWSKPGATVTDAQGACRVLKSAANADRESFYVIALDARGRSLGVEEVAKGHLTGVEVHPRETFKSAILSNASFIIVGHNHPSGDPSPSSQDIELTKRLAEAGKLLGIPLRDHVIIAAEGCTSLRERYGDEAMGFGRARDGRGPARRRHVGLAVGLGVGGALLALVLATRT